MSLPVGTLVMLVRATEMIEFNGTVATIIGPLKVRDLWDGPFLCYDVGLIDEHGWRVYPGPHQVIPITPPGKTDDVTHDIDNEVTA